MGFLRRLLGDGDRAPSAEPRAAKPPAAEPAGDPDEDERRHEYELMAAEAARLDDFLRRQERYADRSWVPPAQGTGRRSDDADRED